MNKSVVIAATVISIVWIESAFAYVGPGAGLSLLGALWGLIAAVVAALGFVILWPLRRARRNRAAAKRAAAKEPRRTDEHRRVNDDVRREPS